MTDTLPLFATPAPAVSSGDVEQLILELRGCGWCTARRLARLWPHWDDRTIRAMASASAGRIISGQKGYALIEEATVEEVRHAAAWLRHQGNQMIRRAHEIEQAMHTRGGQKETAA